MNLEFTAEVAATELHESVNQKYDKYLPYIFHIKMAVAIGRKYIYLIPSQDHKPVLSGIWLHDTIEDCRQTYNDIVKIFRKEHGEATAIQIAELVYAVSNEKGKNREGRANPKFFSELRSVRYATYIKLSDRMANVFYGAMTGGSMFKGYFHEHKEFLSQLNQEELAVYKPMIDDLDELFATGKFSFFN